MAPAVSKSMAYESQNKYFSEPSQRLSAITVIKAFGAHKSENRPLKVPWKASAVAQMPQLQNKSPHVI